MSLNMGRGVIIMPQEYVDLLALENGKRLSEKNQKAVAYAVRVITRCHMMLQLYHCDTRPPTQWEFDLAKALRDGTVPDWKRRYDKMMGYDDDAESDDDV